MRKLVPAVVLTIAVVLVAAGVTHLFPLIDLQNHGRDPNTENSAESLNSLSKVAIVLMPF